jgi:hypothetical protein
LWPGECPATFFLFAAIARQKGKASLRDTLREAGLTRRVLSLRMSWSVGYGRLQTKNEKINNAANHFERGAGVELGRDGVRFGAG